MNKLKCFLSVIDGINDMAGRMVSYLALFMMVSVVYEVIARYFFNRPTIWSMEINQYVLCVYTALAGGYAMLYAAHVNVDILYERLKVRTRAFLNLLTSGFFFLFVGVLIWNSGAIAWETWLFSERSETLLEAPLFPSKVVIPLGGLLLLLQGMAKFIQDMETLITGNEPARRAGLFQSGEEE